MRKEVQCRVIRENISRRILDGIKEVTLKPEAFKERRNLWSIGAHIFFYQQKDEIKLREAYPTLLH